MLQRKDKANIKLVNNLVRCYNWGVSADMKVNLSWSNYEWRRRIR